MLICLLRLHWLFDVSLTRDLPDWRWRCKRCGVLVGVR